MSSPLISLRGISYRPEDKNILSDINFTVNRGDFVAITGPNGGGKTTLLRIILRLIRPTSGTLTYLTPDGKITDRLDIGYLPQKNMIDSHFPITVEEVITSGLLSSTDISKEEKKSRMEQTLIDVDLCSHRNKTIGTLSGGQLQRALLGRAIISRPKFLVLDEPLSYLDKHFEEQLYGLISRLAEEATVLLVSHEMSVIAGMANRHLIVDHTLHECTAAHHYIPSPCR